MATAFARGHRVLEVGKTVEHHASMRGWASLLVRCACTGVTLVWRPALCSAAVDLPTTDADYLVDAWTSDDGLPQNSVVSIAQTSDGYLWLSTFDGLARFDGRRFEVFVGDKFPDLAGQFWTTMRADANGGLWLRSLGGRVVLEAHGHFRTLGKADGVPDSGAKTLQAGFDGSIYIGDDGGKILKWTNGLFAALTQTPPARDWGEMETFKLAADGKVWAISHTRVACWDGSHWSLIPSPNSSTWISGMHPMRDGSVVFIVSGKADQLFRFSNGQYSDMGFMPANYDLWIFGEGADGDLWFSSRDAVLRRQPGGHWSRFPYSELGGGVRSDFLDREGNEWLGTDGGGLLRLKPRVAQSFGMAAGLRNKVALSVGVDGTNSAWVAVLGGGLNHFDGTRFSSVVIPPWLDSTALAWSVRPVRNGVWIGTYDNQLMFLNADHTHLDRFTHTNNVGMVGGLLRALFESSNGDIWIGADGGLSRFSQGKFRTWTTTNGLAADQVNAITEDNLGSIWIGTSGGLNCFHDEQMTTVPLNGQVAGNDIHALFCDSDGNLWMGGYDLTRIRQGRLKTIHDEDGLPINDIRAIIEDDLGFLWASTAHGLQRANLNDLNAFCEKGEGPLKFTVFTRSDGLASGECSGYQPAAAKGPDGRLWFPTLNGVAVIDPGCLPWNGEPPPVVVESVLADEKPIALGDDERAIRIPPGSSRLEFHFVALSYTAPEKNQYSFRLEGLDKDWSHAGTSQAASYSHVPPGNYRFHVRASNNDGVWNQSGVVLAVTVLPFFWETGWFAAFVVAAGCGVVVWTVRHRLAWAERQRLVQEAFARQLIETQETERQRIARELHDGVGQSLLLAKNSLAAGMQKAEPASPVLHHMGQASDELTRSIEEVRATARTLRPVELDRLGLAKALEAMIQRARAGTPIRLDTELDDLGKSAAPEIEIQLYRIAQEAINNVLKHSNAQRAIVELKLEQDGIRLTVQDNGQGFDAATAQQKLGSGLSGMAERARLIGGVLTVNAAAGSGCRLTVKVLPTKNHEQDQRIYS